MTPEVEKRRVTFTIPQYWALGRLLRGTGMLLHSHRPDLDLWDARELFEHVEARFPHQTTRELMMRDAILKKLEWARGERTPKTLVHVLGDAPQ